MLAVLFFLTATDTPAARAAAQAVKAIASARMTVSQQAVLATNALAAPEAGLGKYRGALLAIGASVDAATRQQLIAQILLDHARDFIKRSCEATMKELSQLSVGPLVAKCHLYEQRLLPTLPVAYLQRASLLLAAFFMDVLRERKASKDELTLARWLAYLDAEGAAIAKP